MRHIFNWKHYNISSFERKLLWENHVFHLFTPWKRLVFHFLCFLKGMMLKKKDFTLCQVLVWNFYNVSDFQKKKLQSVRFWIKFAIKKWRSASFYTVKTTGLAHLVFFWKAMFGKENFIKCYVLNSKTFQVFVSFCIQNFNVVRFLKTLPSTKSSFASFSSVKTTCFVISHLLKKYVFENRRWQCVRFWFEKFTICQFLNYQIYNALYLQLKTFEPVKVWKKIALKKSGVSCFQYAKRTSFPFSVLF